MKAGKCLFLYSLVFCFTLNLYAITIDFESPLPSGLVPMDTFISGNPVANSSVISNQFSDLGILFHNAAVVNLGVGHAPSGSNGIGSIDAFGNLDYGSPITITFISPIDGTKAVTDYFSVTTDLVAHINGHTMVISAYALDGTFVSSISYTEHGDGGVAVQFQNSGYFHKIVIDSTYDVVGGMALDLVTFGQVVPEPSTLFLLGIGGVLLKKRNKNV